MGSCPSRTLACHVVALALASTAAAQTLDGRPLRTDSARALALGAHEVEIGAEYQQGLRPVALLDPGTGDLVRVPVVRWRMGLGRAEVQVSGAAWQSFDDSRAGVPSSEEVGDFTLWCKVQATRGAGSRPVLGLAFGAKMPNASDESRLGTDETDFFGQLLLEKDWKASEIRLNLGLAILGDPLRTSSQEDLLTYGVGGRHGRAHQLTWEIFGRALGSDARELDQSSLRLGWATTRARFGADASVVAGLAESSGDLGLSAGVTLRLGASRAADSAP